DLREAIRTVSFTPGAADFAALCEMLGAADDAAVSDAERALLRAGGAAATFAIARFESVAGAARARLCRFVGRAAAEHPDPDAAAVPFLLERLGDADARTRRAAATALGRFA